MTSVSTRLLALAGSAVLTTGILSGAASGSEYRHPTVVSDRAERWVPTITTTPGVSKKPVAYTVAEAGTQMVVGGRFGTVEASNRGAQLDRQNVFAFDATTGEINEGFAPDVDNMVWSAVSDGTSVWIGGAFRTVNGQSRPTVAKLDLATGALDPDFNPPLRGGRITDLELHDDQLIAAGTFRRKLMSLNPTTGRPTKFIGNTVQGRLPRSNAAQVFKFDISDDGEHLAAVGNFTAVDDQPRPRMFLLDLAESGSTLSDWNYEPNAISCTSDRTIAAAYIQDVDFAPGSDWFAVVAFGYMYQSGQRGEQLCDSVSRFETDDLNPSRPTWINYTGGDSLKSVAVTDAAVYVQGHSRWLDNPYGKDSKSFGAVDRLGGGAVDPQTGYALPWNPVMPQQSGGYEITPTAQGVWFATDGIRFGGRYHRGIRFAALP